MQPHKDTDSGDLDTWPAHASAAHGSTGTAVHVTKDKHLVVINTKPGTAKSQLAPKPKYLEQLERYLEKELASLGATEVKASEPRLQVLCVVFIGTFSESIRCAALGRLFNDGGSRERTSDWATGRVTLFVLLLN